MGAILVRDVLHRVSVQLGDIEPQFVGWLERELVDWLNDGARAIAKFLPTACAKIDSVKLAAGTLQSIAKIPSANILPGDGSSAADTYGIRLNEIVRNMGANGATPGSAIRIVAREALDAFSPGWHSAAWGGAVSEYTFDPRHPTQFYVNPGVTGTWWVEIAYCANPRSIPNTGTPGAKLYAASGSSTTTIDLGDQYVDDLVNYVLARAFLKDQTKAANVAGADRAFLSSLNAQVKAETGKNPNLIVLPFTPGVPAAEK